MDSELSIQYSIEVLFDGANEEEVRDRLSTLDTVVHSTSVTGSTVVAVLLCRSETHQSALVEAIVGEPGLGYVSHEDRTFKIHEGGKIGTSLACDLDGPDDLSMAYTPGVARVCKAIEADVALARRYTIAKNTVAIVSDGTAVLGLGNIGPHGAMPVMEGKAALFKRFGGVDAVPLCLATCDPKEIVDTVVRLAPSFGGINLEDIAAPACFEIEQALIDKLDIPVFHDDQHGTAIVATAALLNALKLVNKEIEDVSVVVSGLGAAGIAVANMFCSVGVKRLTGVDSKGVVHGGRGDLNPQKMTLAKSAQGFGKDGTLADAMKGADVFVGVSVPGLLSPSDVRSMATEPIVFAMANPVPEILPSEVDGTVAVMATGRSDFPNQINNVLAFPGVFRGALDCGATSVTEGMTIAAAKAIAECVSETELAPDYVVPSPFDPDVVRLVAKAVAEAWEP